MRLHALPAVGEGAVGGAKACGGDAVGHRAEREGEVRVPLCRGDAKALQLRAQGADADRLRKIDRGNIQRAGRAPRAASLRRSNCLRRCRADSRRRRRAACRPQSWWADSRSLRWRRHRRRPLDGAAGLTLYLCGAVEPQAHVVGTSADKGHDLAVFDVLRHQRRLRGRAVRGGVGEVGAIFKQFLCRGLGPGIQRRVNGVTAGEQFVAADV